MMGKNDNKTKYSRNAGTGDAHCGAQAPVAASSTCSTNVSYWLVTGTSRRRARPFTLSGSKEPLYLGAKTRIDQRDAQKHQAKNDGRQNSVQRLKVLQVVQKQLEDANQKQRQPG